jgi:choline monooxygenase
VADHRFDIDADIRRASTPPSWVYTDRVTYDLARESVFARSWQLVATVDQVRVPGQVYPFTLLEGCLDEPLLLVRDEQDTLRCVSNVCTHRGNLVCEHAGIERGLRCRYHGRRFGLDGSFQSMPEFEGVVGFPAATDHLRAVVLRTWGPFVFVNLDPSVPFDTWIEPMRSRLGWMPLAEMTFNASRSREYLVRANWALYCENYLEGFHIPFVHASLHETLDYGQYRTELYRYSNLQVGIAQTDLFEFPVASPDHGQPIAAFYYWLFPNAMFNFYPWGLSVNVVKPLDVDRTRVSFLTYVLDPAKLDQGAGSGLDRVEREDEAIVESVQRGLRSRLYSRGRYSPTREQWTHHFHRLLAEFLGSKP